MYRELIEAWPRIYVSMNKDTIGSGNGFPFAQRQAITWTNDEV